MHLSREIDELLDYLAEQENDLSEGKGKSKEILAEIKEIKAEIMRLTHNGKRAKGLWTDMPEFTMKPFC